jgi:hypothetical protein
MNRLERTLIALVAAGVPLCATPGQLYAQAAAPAPLDERDTFESSFFTGVAIDTFAGADSNLYLNPGASGGPKERLVAGVDFAYRLVGSNGDRKPQLWVFGETVHGVRSRDVDCAATPDLPVCKSAFDPATAGDRALYILRNASTLEAFVGVRWEAPPIQVASGNAARPYLVAQAGLLSVADGPDDAVDSHLVGLGLEAVAGRHTGSHLEIGYGRTDLFLQHPQRRFKVDALLTWSLREHVMPFVQFTLDSDLGRGSDAIQTYVGVDLDLSALLSFGAVK